MSHHVTDIAAYVLVATGATVAMAPPDFAALGVAAIGGVIGGYLSVSIMPEERAMQDPDKRRRSLAAKWAVSTLASIAFTPFLFQRWTEVADGVVPILPRSAEAMLALSSAVAFVAWGSLFICQWAWQRWLKDKLAPPKDEHEDGGP